MNEEIRDELMEMNTYLNRIADALERLSRGGEAAELNLVQPIELYAAFDWSSIGATVVQMDPEGPTHVQWEGQVYTRRSPSNKYDPAIWYSRPAGKDDAGNVKYSRLITFKTMKDAEPLDRKAARAVQGGKQ